MDGALNFVNDDLHKKMRKPVRSQKDYKSYTKFRAGEGMVMAQTVAELGARFTA